MAVNKSSLRWIGIFTLYLWGIFWGTFNASWYAFGFNVLVVELFIIFILVTQSSGGAN